MEKNSETAPLKIIIKIMVITTAMTKNKIDDDDLQNDGTESSFSLVGVFGFVVVNLFQGFLACFYSAEKCRANQYQAFPLTPLLPK